MITLELVPHSEIEKLSSVGRIRKLLKIAKEHKIALLEGRLAQEEEAELIKATMEEIDDEFKGIELAVIYPQKPAGGMLARAKSSFIEYLLGNRSGLTIIGPASVVKAIKRDPTKIQLLTRDLKRGKRR